MKETKKGNSAATQGVRVWAIIGDANAGKSTMIGHLTYQYGPGKNGLWKGRSDKVYEVLLRGGGCLSVWSRRMALQEAGLTPEQAMLEISKNFEGDRDVGQPRNILVALRDRQHSGLADGNEYLSHFAAMGWKLQSIVMMPSVEQVNRYTRLGVPTCVLTPIEETSSANAASMSIGHRVGKIRNHFGWA